jgi:hypothetical protein
MVGVDEKREEMRESKNKDRKEGWKKIEGRTGKVGHWEKVRKEIY